MLSGGIRLIFHYLDDFVTVGASHSHKCQLAYKTMLATCEQLGFPVAHAKCKGPMACLSFLGIEVDTASMQLRLPANKLERVNNVVNKWVGRKCITKKELSRWQAISNMPAKWYLVGDASCGESLNWFQLLTTRHRRFVST